MRFKARPVPTSSVVPKYEHLERVAAARSLGRKLERKAMLADSLRPFKGLELHEAKQRARELERHPESWRPSSARRQEDEERQRVRNEHMHGNGHEREREFEHGLSRRPRSAGAQSGRSSGGASASQFSGPYSGHSASEWAAQERRDLRAQQLLREARMPRRLAAHAQDEAERRAERELAEEAAFRQTHTFRPRVAGEVPDYERSQRLWHEALKGARRSGRPTRADVSDLSMFSQEAEHRRAERQRRRLQQRDEEEAELEASLASNPRLRRSRSARARRALADESARATVRVTKTQVLRLRKSQEALLSDEDHEARRAVLEAAEAARASQRSDTMRRIVAHHERKRQAQPGFLSLEDAQRKARDNAAEDRRRWAAREAELAKLREERPGEGGRPTLLERTAEGRRKEERRQQALLRVSATLQKSDTHKRVLSRDEMDQVDFQIAMEASK
jgi:hypothetical protein